MGLDGTGRNGQSGADLVVGVPGGDESQHLAFAPGELVEFGARGRRLAAEGVEDEASQAGREVRVSTVDTLDRLAHVGTADRLRDVAPGVRSRYGKSP
jgi:hypothetical protein